MTAREYYDLLVETSASGKFPAYDAERKTCSYRTADGRKCAVGVPVPDEEYNPEWDSGSSGLRASILILRYFLDEKPWWPEGLDGKTAEWIQEIHDVQGGCETWDHDRFVRELSSLDYFREATREAC